MQKYEIGNKAIVITSLIALCCLMFFTWIDQIPHLSDGVLAITAIILVWYSLETSLMRREVAKQNRLLTRPIVILEFSDRRIFFKNEGKGPALNLSVKDLKISHILQHERRPIRGDGVSYQIMPVAYLAQESRKEMTIFKEIVNKNLEGTVSEPDIFFELGSKIEIALTYKDMEGSKYKTYIRIQSGMQRYVSFHDI